MNNWKLWEPPNSSFFGWNRIQYDERWVCLKVAGMAPHFLNVTIGDKTINRFGGAIFSLQPMVQIWGLWRIIPNIFLLFGIPSGPHSLHMFFSEGYIVIYSNYGRVCLILPGCWKHTRSIVNPHESPMCGSHKGLNTKPVRLHWNTRCVKDSCFAMEEIGLETDHLSVPYASMCHISLSIPMTTAKILVNPSLNRWTMEFVNGLVSGYIAPSCKGKHPIANKLTPVTLWI